MSTDPDHKLNGTPEPFRRPIVWGRPPATVFRTGPLPKGERLAPTPDARSEPRRPAGPGILSGSMIPRATPSAQQQASGAVVAPPSGPGPAVDARPQPAPRPASAPGPVRSGTDLAARPVPAPEPRPEPEARPVSAPAAVASPAAGPAAPAARARQAPSRTLLYLGIAAAAVAVLVLGSRVLVRAPADTPVTPASAVPAPVAAPAATPIEASEASEAAPALSTVAAEPTPVPAPAEPVVAPAPAAAPRAAPPVQPPAVVTPAPEAAAPPLVVIAPAGPPPTAAEPPPSDPGAPIETRPQPLD